jgi:hypothetical protein
MKNSVFWDIKTQLVPHRRYTTSPLQSPTNAVLRFEVFTAVTRKNAVFCDVTPCGCCKDRRLGGSYRLHHKSDKNEGARSNVSSN